MYKCPANFYAVIPSRFGALVIVAEASPCPSSVWEGALVAQKFLLASLELYALNSEKLVACLKMRYAAFKLHVFFP